MIVCRYYGVSLSPYRRREEDQAQLVGPAVDGLTQNLGRRDDGGQAAADEGVKTPTLQPPLRRDVALCRSVTHKV